MEEKREVLTIETLENILSKGGLFIWDTTALVSGGFKSCMQNLFQLIQNNPDGFVVPSFVVDNLDSSAIMPRMMIEKSMFKIVNEINSYEEFFNQLKAEGINRANVLVNGSEERTSILSVAKTTGIFVFFYTIEDTGEIVKPVRSQGRENVNSNKKVDVQEKSYREKTQKRYRFEIKTRPEKVEFSKIQVEKNLELGEIVVDSNLKEYRLVKQEAVNNGAVTYSTDVNGIWVKLFNKTELNTYIEAKINRMLLNPIKKDGICWPIDIIKDANGMFRGYILNEYKGIPLHLCVFKRAGIDKYFPNWNKQDLCELTETILNKIEVLHKQNVLFGCINPAAIRVVSNKEVYFTDTDDYQVEGFPSMVHNISFTPPELLDKKIYLASMENENFAIAELVFMLMMPGKTPYAVGGDETPIQLIKSMNFPYSSGKIHGQNALPGMWRFMWSHLSSLKGSFVNVFQNGAKFNKPEERRDVRYWINAVGHYKNDLQEIENRDSLNIYPKGFKKEKDDIFYRCKYCGTEHPRFYFNNQYFEMFQICNSCIDKMSDVSFTCQVCHKKYYYTNKMALFHKQKKIQDSDWKNQKYCRDCKQKTIPCKSCGKDWPYFQLVNDKCPDCNQAVYAKRNCEDCYSQFEITYRLYEDYTRKGWDLPTRCPDCRARRKADKELGRNTKSYSTSKPTKKRGIFGWF